MTSLLCVSISFLLFFFLRETHGAFRIQFTGKITKLHRIKPTTMAEILNADQQTEVTLYKGDKEVAKTNVNSTDGTYTLVAQVPVNEKNGDYKLEAHRQKLVGDQEAYGDQDHTFTVSNKHKSHFTGEWDTRIILVNREMTMRWIGQIPDSHTS
ncbi:hypothetical protein DdX_18685 [Ditylenchus destructor]|uniref:Uncharacterized protein n=1 Tax=Ditylenchus destructor TaxID=166010 RepID=A0AAD4MKA4_9BILA|nr:hypothetical protein DdX_18685 [Ditylenchus destructor]